MTPRISHHPAPSSGAELAFAIWERRKWLGIAVFSATLAVVTSLTIGLPDLYRSAATVLVERQQVSEAFVRPSVSAELETRIQTIRQDITSRARLSGLIAELNLYPELRSKAPMEAIVERMRRDIDLDPIGVEQQLSGRQATIAFTVTYTGRDPETVARVANTLASLYVQENTKIRERQATRTAEFLKAQLDSAKRELDQQEERANDFKLQHLAELPQQLEANLASLERLNTQLRLNGENQIRVMDRRERLERQLADLAADAPRGLPAAAPVAQLAELRRKLNETRRTFSDEYPDVKRLRSEIAALEEQVEHTKGGPDKAVDQAEQARSRLTATVSDTEDEMRTLREEERALRLAIIGYEQRVENAPKRQQEFLELSRGSESTAERYNSLLKRYEEAQLAASLEQGADVEQFRILDPAIPPRVVAAPNRVRLFAMGLVFAIALAIGTMVVVERLDTAFHTVEDLRAFAALPVLVRIPRIVTKRETRRRRWRFALATVCLITALAMLVAGTGYVAVENEEIVRLMARG